MVICTLRQVLKVKSYKVIFYAETIHNKKVGILEIWKEYPRKPFRTLKRGIFLSKIEGFRAVFPHSEALFGGKAQKTPKKNAVGNARNRARNAHFLVIS